MWLTPAAEGGTVYRLLPIPAGFLSQINGALIPLEYEGSWEPYGAMTPEECAAVMTIMLEAFWSAKPLLGTIHAYATDSLPDGVLLCNGDQYARTDYPDLYAVLAAPYIVDADHFVTPDLVDRVIMGTETEQGDVLGTAEETLTALQMPVHGHADYGHTHTEGIAVPNLTTIGLEVPEPTALPAAGISGIGFANLADAGGGQSHNNIQPSHKMKFGIIAR